mmetsp:Transcript_5627/g.8873  ORF Transcript_5627/g.8873 Transcript_5627/m.8873 type:complete len:497 (-) Transcript_5627:141-1631(-)
MPSCPFDASDESKDHNNINAGKEKYRRWIGERKFPFVKFDRDRVALDDSCQKILRARKLEVFELLTGETLCDAKNRYRGEVENLNVIIRAAKQEIYKLQLHKGSTFVSKSNNKGSTNITQKREDALLLRINSSIDKRSAAQGMIQNLDRIERAVNIIPSLIGCKRVVEQLVNGGIRALDHIEVPVLIQREAIERNRLKDYINLAATDSRITEFEKWVMFINKVKIGRRKPEIISYLQAKDIYNTTLEPLAAMLAARHWPDSKISLGNDMSTRISTAGGKRARGKKSFDLTVRLSGEIRSNVEVTSADEVSRPRDLYYAINHGIEKAKAMKGKDEDAWREVSIGIKWKRGSVHVEHKKRIQYHGDGTYHVYQRQDDGKELYLYKRHILLDDFPHYLERHKKACRWLDSITIFTIDGDHSYNIVQNGHGWDIEHSAATDVALSKRRTLRRMKRGYLVSSNKLVQDSIRINFKQGEDIINHSMVGSTRLHSRYKWQAEI